MAGNWKKAFVAVMLCIGSIVLVPQHTSAAQPGGPAAGQAALTVEYSLKAKRDAILPAPGSLDASGITYQSVTLYWGKVTGAKGYQVEYSENGASFTVAGKTAADVNTFQCKKLFAGTEYQFRVCALDAQDRAGNYALIKAKPYLKKTTVTKAEPTGGQSVSLEWKKTAGATSYQVFRKKAEEKVYRLAAETEDTVYTDAGVETGGQYLYCVRAIRKKDGKTAKAKLSAPVEAAVIVKPLQLESCSSVGSFSVKLAWKQAEGVTGYYIYRSVKEDGTYRKIKTLTSNTALSYIDNGVVPGKKFYYKIATYRQAGGKIVKTGALSDSMYAQPVMAAPKLKPVSIGNSGIVLEWEKVEEASGYRIYKSEYFDKGFQKAADIAGGATCSYEDPSAVPGKVYYYRIKAVVQNGTYKGLSKASSVLQAQAPAGAPMGLAIRQTATDVLDISWKEVPGAAGYNLYRAEDGAAVYTCIAKGLHAAAYQDTARKDDRTYTYRVSAVGAAGEGVQSIPASYTVGGISLSTRTLKVCEGASKELEVQTFRKGKVVWHCSDAGVAEVDSTGKVTGVSCGTAEVTATVAGKSASAEISVVPGKKHGVDVSSREERIDWYRVKGSGVDFAFLRIVDHDQQDAAFETNYTQAKLAGMQIGVSCYSRAQSVEEAEEEAKTVLRLLNGRKLDHPVALIMEDAVHKAESMIKEKLHQIIGVFKNNVEDAGYQFVLYSQVSFLNANLDKRNLEGIDLWVARYRALASGTGYNGTGNQKYWQYNNGQFQGSSAQVDGITDKEGNLVPVNVNIEL